MPRKSPASRCPSRTSSTPSSCSATTRSRPTRRARGTRTFLMELLIRRELLAQEGERLGFRISEEEIGDRIEKGRILVVGVPRNITMDYRFASIYKDGFDYQKYKQNFLTY